MTRGKLKKLGNVLKRHSLDALLIMNPVNRKYITGLSTSLGFLILTRGSSVLYLDSRYIEIGKTWLTQSERSTSPSAIC